LKTALNLIPNCRLIIVDPVNAFVGTADCHYHSVVRRVLEPLTQLAAEKRLAVVAIAQLRKNDGHALHRAAGSIGFVAAARSLWTVCRDPRDVSRNLLLPLKNNLTDSATGLAFRIVESPGASAPRIVWELETSVPTPEEAFARPRPPRPPSPERVAARKWLEEALADGPWPARIVIQQGEARGFLPRTLRRAFHELGGQPVKRGLWEGWTWSLPNQDHVERIDTLEEATKKCAVPFEGVTPDGMELQDFEPTVAESMRALDQARPPREPLTGDEIIAQLIDAFKKPPPDSLDPTSNGGTCSAPSTPHPPPAAKAEAKARRHISRSRGSTAQSPALPTPARPSHAPGSSGGSNYSHRGSSPAPP
jgi:hypothetical protein